MTKRIIGLVLALCLIVGLLPMVALADEPHTHTPVGAGTELADQRVNASLDAKGTVYGKYVMQYTCADCGQTYTEDVAFGPALLHYKTVAQDSSKNTAGDPVEATNYNTWGAANAGNDYKPCVVMNPGDAARYFVTKGGHATFINNSYVEELTDADKIAAGEWNIKMEYPVLGTPTLTMKGANITNTAGLWLGRGVYTTSVDYKIVIEEDSTIAQTCSYNGASDKAVQGAGNLNLMTTGDVTITGPGKLTLISSSYAKAAIYSTTSDIILDGADIELTKLDSMLASRTSDGIYTKNNNLTIKNSKVNIFCYCPSKGAGGLDSYRGLSYSLYAGKALTIETSDVDIAVSMSGSNASSPFAIYGNDVTFKDSDVTVSHGGVYYGKAIGYKNSFTAEYTNGYTAYNSGSRFSYNKETGAVTYPTGKAFTDLTADNLKTYFVEFKHNCFDNTDDFDCTAADTCDLCGKTIGEPEATAHTPAADDGDCTTDILCANEGCKQVAVPGAAAHTPEADDGDVTTEVKCSVCGTVTTPAVKPSIRFNYEVPGTSTYKVMNAGDAPIYWKTGNFSASEPETFYMKDNGTENDWNVKLEYPANGIPTMTLKNAKIIEGRTITFVGEGATTGTAPFAGDVKLVLEGDNYISCNNNYTSDIYFNITGTATITGTGKLKVEHALNSSGKTGLIHSKGSLVLDNANIELDLPSAYARVGGGVFAEGANLTIKGGNLDIVGYNPYASDVKDPETGAVTISWSNYRPIGAALKSGGDITIEQGAKVRIITSSSNSQTKSIIKTGANGTVAIKNSDVEVASVSGTYLKVFDTAAMPTIALDYTAGYELITSTSKGTYALDTDTFTTPAASKLNTYTDIAEADVTAVNYLKITHGCYSAADDKDCTTVENCDLCGQPIGTALTHTAGADDGDCTTAVKCANPGCEQIAVEAKASHTPEADDGDCTTAIKCSLCGTETTAAEAAHTGGTATCKDLAKCDKCGKEYGTLLTTHVPEADDGDCTTAIKCSICGTETTAAEASHTGGTATCKELAKCDKCGKEYGALSTTHTGGTATCKDKAVCTICGQEYGEKLTTHTPGERTDCSVDTMCTVCGQVAIAAGDHTGGTATCKDKAKCSVCGKEYGELLTTHVPNADDGDCTTAITCSICGTETTAAKATHTPEADDGDCTTAIKCSVCGKETTAAKAAHTPEADDGDCTTAIKCSVCGKETTAAKAAHTPTADDGDCTTAIKCSVCGKETTAAKAAHTYTDSKDTSCDNAGCTNTRTVSTNPETGDVNILLIAALALISVVGFTGVTVLRKKEN